ncbi:MAG: two-component system, OmpR family, operon response regulator KdpE [Acidobacteriota bacterium]|nr:two-component system, OmpR family, operon response regulator KdpE [Acidobacteriota bacterium]
MGEKQRILIVDDEPQITRVLRRGLTTHGYEVRAASDGLAALQAFGDWPPDLVITDLSMPHAGGLELCRDLRAISHTPIIVLSVRGEESTKVQALDAGADDYVTKPFGMNELLARIRAALRRASATGESGGVASPVLEAGDFRVDLENRRVAVKGTEVHLTPKEYDLMVYLVGHPGKVLTHRTLLVSVWGGESAEQTEYLRVFVGQLRKKIEPDTASPRYILTEPWVGYRFDPGA